MLVSRTFAPARAFLAASLPLAALLAGCDGPSHAPPPLTATVTATDATGPLVRGQNAVFTFVVTNPSSSDLPALQLRASSAAVDDGTYALTTTGATCAAHGASCPAFTSAGLAGPFTLPAGGVLTFTVTAQVNEDYDGTATLQLDAYSEQRSGDAHAAGQVALTDARDGYYELFTTSGLLDNVDVGFKAGATKFATAPTKAESTFVAHQAGYVFPSGAVFQTGPDILVGQADFGHGPETFIGARNGVFTLAELDGSAFTLMGVTTPAGGSATSTARAVAISGATLTACADATPHAIASCPVASLRQYVLTQQSTVAGFIATDAADNDSFVFQVFHTGDRLLMLQAGQSGAGGAFAVGLSDAAIVSSEVFGLGAVAGAHMELDLKPGTFSLSPVDLDAHVLSQGATAALAPLAGGPTGLVAGVRPSDNAALLLLEQSGLVLISGPAGEFDALIDAPVPH